MSYHLDFGWIEKYFQAIVNGIGVTLGLIAVTAILGLGLSILGAASRRSSYRLLRGLVAGYVELIRNTPFVVQLFFVYFGLPTLGLRMDAWTAAVLAMTVNLAAYGTEIVRAGLDAVPAGQREAGRGLGMRGPAIFLMIVLPQAVRNVFPALSSQIIITMLESAVVSQIAVRDLTYEADLMQSQTFRSFETYALITGIYLALSVAIRRLFRSGGERLFGLDLR